MPPPSAGQGGPRGLGACPRVGGSNPGPNDLIFDIFVEPNPSTDNIVGFGPALACRNSQLTD